MTFGSFYDKFLFMLEFLRNIGGKPETQETTLGVKRLVSFTTELRSQLKSAGQEPAKTWTQEQVSLPATFKSGEAKLEDLAFGKKSPRYHFLISGHREISLNDTWPILNEFHRRTQTLQLKKGHDVTLEYGLFWTPEGFSEEQLFPQTSVKQIEIKARTVTHDPNKLRFGGTNYQRHGFEVNFDADDLELKITAERNYRKDLKRLIEILKPQKARVRLSQRDAKRLLKNPEVSSRLKKELQPQEGFALGFDRFGGGIQPKMSEVIETIVSLDELRLLSERLRKNLINPKAGQESQVVEFAKGYNPFSLLTGEVSKDLKNAANFISQIISSKSDEQPLISTEQARAFLERETEITQEMYENQWKYILGGMPNVHIFRGRLVKGLAREAIGDKVVERFDELSVTDYPAFLESQGYKPQGVAENEPDYIQKELHLFEFFKQVFEKDPTKAIEKYRQYYTLRPPQLEITAKVKEDATKVRQLKLPQYAKIYSLKLDQWHVRSKSGYGNDLSISRSSPSADDIFFWSRTSLDQPILLPLQEWACSKMGIIFNQ